MDFYLITGFLGAGKTTFLKAFVRLFPVQKIYLIINEFGKTGVDGALLQEMHATLAEINNGSIFCACRLDKFEATLAQAIASEPNIILVEASGLADPTAVCKVLSAPAYSAIHYKGSVCLVDTPRFEKVVQTARVCPKQLAVSSLALLNKTDLASPQQLVETRARVLAVNPAITLRETQYGRFEAEWLVDIQPQAAVSIGGDGMAHGADITLQKASITLAPAMQLAQLRSFLAMLAEDTYRIKGFAQLENQTWLVDCVGPLVNVSPYKGETNGQPNRLVALAGKGMPLRKALKNAVQWYAAFILETEI